MSSCLIDILTYQVKMIWKIGGGWMALATGMNLFDLFLHFSNEMRV
jgi:hypothetical protein